MSNHHLDDDDRVVLPCILLFLIIALFLFA